MSILDKLTGDSAATIAKMVMDTINNDPELKKDFDALVSGDSGKKDILTGMMTKVVQTLAAQMVGGDGEGSVLSSVLKAFKE
ncbi:MAG: hypothetical protein LUF25_03080 [Phascolarctobacterium sp.]|nr:hypothetical protein [Phascolarctobacterium sp.]